MRQVTMDTLRAPYVYLGLTVALLAVAEGYSWGRAHRRPLAATPNNTRTFSVDRYLEKYGYLEAQPPNAQRSPEARVRAIRDFQRLAGLRATGRLDRATRRKMRAPRCGNPDVVPEGRQGALVEDGRGRAASYSLPGYRWRKKHLTWRLLNTSPDLEASQQRRAFSRALRYWSAVSGLSFSEVRSGRPDISLQFATGNHGDGARNAFDEQGGVLAHAFYPPEGRAHFDEAERWSADGAPPGSVHLETVAAHELGHVLGLGHSAVTDALMAPYYRYDPQLSLHDDDVRAIRRLYGGQSLSPGKAPTEAPTEAPTQETESDGDEAIDVCSMKFDAILRAHDGSLYVFRYDKVWRLTTWALLEGYPVLADEVYNRLPHNVGAAVYSNHTRYTYFFKGRTIYQYYEFHRIGRLRVSGEGYPSSPQAAFVSRDGNIYVFQGAYYWRFDESRQHYIGGATPIAARWPGLPVNAEAAVGLQDGFLYVIKGDRYRKYDEFGRRVMAGYPRPKAGPFMGPVCGGRYVPK